MHVLRMRRVLKVMADPGQLAQLIVSATRHQVTHKLEQLVLRVSFCYSLRPSQQFFSHVGMRASWVAPVLSSGYSEKVKQ